MMVHDGHMALVMYMCTWYIHGTWYTVHDTCNMLRGGTVHGTMAHGTCINRGHDSAWGMVMIMINEGTYSSQVLSNQHQRLASHCTQELNHIWMS